MTIGMIRKILVFVVGLALFVLNHTLGLELFGITGESDVGTIVASSGLNQAVDIVISLLTGFGIFQVSNDEAPPAS